MAGAETWVTRMARLPNGIRSLFEGTYLSGWATLLRNALDAPGLLSLSLVDEADGVAFHEAVWEAFAAFDRHNEHAGRNPHFNQDLVQLCGVVLDHATACAAGRKPPRDALALIEYFFKLVMYHPSIHHGDAHKQAALDALWAVSDAIAAALDALYRSGSEGAAAAADGGAGAAVDGPPLVPRGSAMIMDAREVYRGLRDGLRADLPLILDPGAPRNPTFRFMITHGPMGSFKFLTQLAVRASQSMNKHMRHFTLA